MKRHILIALVAVSFAISVPLLGQQAEKATAEEKAEGRGGDAAAAKETKAPAASAVKTPFGISKRGTAAPKTDTRSQDALIQVVRKGDKYEFRRKTPFGHQVWTKTEAELTATEKRWVTASKPKPETKSASKP